jgi:hypothetical protein
MDNPTSRLGAGLIVLALWACKSAAPAGEPEPPSVTHTEMMEKLMELARPGESHRVLDPLVGEFQAVTSSYMEPGAPPETSEGVMRNRWILGGRFILSEYTGSVLGMPFEGLGLLGYDNSKERFVGTWVDSMGTLIMPVSEGTLADDGKTITLYREMVDPVLGQAARMREVTTLHDQDHHTFEMFSTGTDGREVLTLKTEYTRVGK